MHRMKRLLLIFVMLCSMCTVFVVTAGIASAAPAHPYKHHSQFAATWVNQSNSLRANTNVTVNGGGRNSTTDVQVQGSTNSLTNTFDASNSNTSD